MYVSFLIKSARVSAGHRSYGTEKQTHIPASPVKRDNFTRIVPMLRGWVKQEYGAYD